MKVFALAAPAPARAFEPMIPCHVMDSPGGRVH